MSTNLTLNGLKGYHYQNTYAYSNSFTTSHQQIVPNGTLSGNQAYLVLIDTENGSYGKPPYYSSAAFIFYMCPGTNGSYTNSATAQNPMISTHTGHGGYFDIRATGASNSRSGLALKYNSGPTNVTSGVNLRVTCIRLGTI